MATRRDPRAALCGWLVVLAASSWLVAAADGPVQASQTVDERRGGSLYALYCIACHGSDGAGIPGTGPAAGPPVDAVDAAYVDLTLRTGRMPLIEPRAGVVRDPHLTSGERDALVAWMITNFSLPDGRPGAIAGDPARGHELYARHCSACHGATGAGGVSSDGTLIRSVNDDDPVAVFEATRVGPFEMPRFGPDTLDDQAVNDIATFVGTLPDRPATPLGLAEIDRVTMSLLAVVLALAAFGIVLLVSRPVDMATPPDPEEEGAA